MLAGRVMPGNGAGASPFRSAGDGLASLCGVDTSGRFSDSTPTLSLKIAFTAPTHSTGGMLPPIAATTSAPPGKAEHGSTHGGNQVTTAHIVCCLQRAKTNNKRTC